MLGLGVFLLATATAEAADRLARNAELLINGRRAVSGDAGWPVFPGRANTLTVRAVDAHELAVRLVRIQPDGRRREQSARLTPQSREVVLDLGLFAVPCRFEYESGVVSRRACRFELSLIAPSQTAERWTFLQTVGAGDTDVLAPRGAATEVHWGWAERKRSQPMDPPILLSLSPVVLDDQNDVRVTYQLRAKEQPTICGHLRVAAEKGTPLIADKTVKIGPVPGEVRFSFAGYAPGRYRIEIRPEVQGSADSDGPVIIYRRAVEDAEAVRLSPLASWALRRDKSRTDFALHDLPAGIGQSRPLPLVGFYAVFATTKLPCYVQVGREGLVRGVCGERVFLEAADLTGGQVRIYSAGLPDARLHELRCVPVTAASVREVRERCAAPPTPLRGVADWCDYFAPPSSRHSTGGRLALDQFDTLLGGHAEIGMSSIAWSVGRSWVEYNSRLPDATRFPCTPLEKADAKVRQAYLGRTTMIHLTDPLDYVLSHRAARGLAILPWLAMQRHYGANASGGIFTSRWFIEHPQWHDWTRTDKAPSHARVSYYFPEVRRERVNILCEVAERSPDGVVVGCCRQVPMLLYHPEMVAAYKKRTGIDARTIDATDGQKYVDWIRWRADFFTETLRELKTRLGPIRQRLGRPIPVVVRIPTKGLFYNLAQGLDVERWCRERLLDELQLDPLEDCAGRGGNHDVRPYLELGRRYGLKVFGGVNGNTFWNYPAILRRAIGLCRAGVTGIEIYESNNFAATMPQRWLVPLLGNAPLAQRFLDESNLDACFPIWSRNAAAGFDNHSFHGNWSLEGKGPSSL